MRTRPFFSMPALLIIVLTACGERTAGGNEAPSSARLEAGFSAPIHEDADEDMRELSDYTLTLDDLRKFEQAHRNLKQVMNANPELKARIEAENADDDNSAASLDEIESAFEEEPEARDAIEAAGIGPRDYVLTLLALMQAGMAQAVIDMGAKQDSVLQDLEIHPANLEFARQHKAEIGRVMKEVLEEDES